MSPKDHASLTAQGRVASRLVELKAALDPAADADTEEDTLHTELDEMD